MSSNIIQHEERQERLLRLLQLFQDLFRLNQISWLQSKSLAPFNGSPEQLEQLPQVKGSEGSEWIRHDLPMIQKYDAMIAMKTTNLSELGTA